VPPGKGKAVAPLLEKSFGVICFVNENFDTDPISNSLQEK
jgi:hypothetical protein